VVATLHPDHYEAIDVAARQAGLSRDEFIAGLIGEFAEALRRRGGRLSVEALITRRVYANEGSTETRKRNARLRAMGQLFSSGPLSTPQLTSALGVADVNVHRQLSRLVNEGLAEVTVRSVGSTRMKVWWLTEAGRRWYLDHTDESDREVTRAS
jgi:DNA-binding MarR family transcriptional regulator